MLKDDDKSQFKKSNAEKRVKKNFKKQTMTAVQETDNIYRKLVKGKPAIDGVQHGIQYDEFTQALLEITLLAEKQFTEFKEAHDTYLNNYDDEQVKWEENNPIPKKDYKPENEEDDAG